MPIVFYSAFRVFFRKLKSAQPKLRTEKCKAPIAAKQLRYNFQKKHTKIEHALLPYGKVYTSPKSYIKLFRIYIIAQYPSFCQYVFQKILMDKGFSGLGCLSSEAYLSTPPAAAEMLLLWCSEGTQDRTACPNPRR